MRALSKDTWKILRSCLQWAFLIGLCVFIVQLFMERGRPPQFDRESWTQRDGFTAISYGSLTRDEKPGLNSRQQFAEHVAAIEKAGYQWITTDDVISFYRDGEPLPEKALYLMMEGGRKDSVIFGQEIMGKTGVHASLFTTTGTLKSWNNFFVTKSNVAALAKSPFWDLGSQGLGLLPINENMPKVTPGYFLTDFLRDSTGLPAETEEQMRDRLAAYYKDSFEPLAKLMPEPPKAFVMMPANSFNAAMPHAVKEANRDLVQQYFQMAFSREGAAFNSAVDDRFALTRVQIKPDWPEQHLLEVLSLKTAKRTRFSLAEGDTADSWMAFRTRVEASGRDIVLTPQEGKADPVMLRGSNMWDNVSLSMTIAQKENVDRYVYLRYATPSAFLRVTLHGARLLVQERVPGQGLYTIADETMSTQPPWRFDILLKGNRLKVLLDGKALGPGFLPVSPTLRLGAVALGTGDVEGYEGRFGSLNIVRIPSLWRVESTGSASSGSVVPARAQEVTACVVPLAAGASASSADAERVSRQVLRARAEGSMTIAALSPGNLVLNDSMLLMAPFSMEQSRRLWDGIMVQPLAQSSWKDVAATLTAIAAAGYRPVVRLTRDAAAALAASGVTLPADHYLLDFTRAEIPESLWTPLAHRHNRNNFLYATAEKGVLYAAGGN
ncbi:hypothetical protein [Desulfovibrio desulfuricans]|uniref:hypothetical protein n=1 Tax=Desulfovibrio desulfuricans TaxID=876 RepID=UPI001AE6F440|nr:hypothetical protein [Desulfovibrio desulfuricans]QTO41706.1 hypothetical protein J8J02_07445 [Desulfovibrio desulfuricans]